MINFFSFTLFFLCLINICIANTYIHLDNQTSASLDDVLEDPFLVIRTKCGKPNESMDWQRNWQIWAQLASKMSFLPSRDESIFNDSFAVKGSAILKVTAPHCFDHHKPQFFISFQGKEAPKYVWWQISEDPEFRLVFPNLDVQIPYTDTIRLTDLEETFLNTNRIYYFRVCADHASWSTPIAFQVIKPLPVEKVIFSKLDDHLYKLSWKAQPSPTVTYLIFGSNALDFVPSIYYDKQLNLIEGMESIEIETTYNFICETNQSYLLIEGDYAYYRIIARDQGQLANPSPLIYIYDQNLKPIRTRLKQDLDNPFLFKREAYPTGYKKRNHEFLPFGEKNSSYVYNSLVPQVLWERLEPYFLPVNHPIKERLDRLFQKNRVTQSEETFENGGFKVKKRKPNQIVIGKNPYFKEYIFKVYLDTQPVLHEWDNWLKRIEGARSIQACIEKHGFRHFCVPKKWIYPLPEHPSPSADLQYRKNFILIVENMNILDSKDNLKSFEKKMTPKLLKELYTILTEEGLIDSVYPDNIPFRKNGQIAFIDTEHHHLTPIPYKRLTRFLSTDMQKYWKSLIETKDPL